MERINFENNQAPALNQSTLTKLQDNMEKAGVVISSTKPNTYEKVWIQKGKNLLNISSFETKTLNGVTFTNNGNGSITINGTATDSFGVSFVAFVLKKGTYHLSLNANTLNSFYIYDYDTNESILSKEETATLTKDYDNVGFDTWVVQGDAFNNITISPQLEVGDKATSFEAYVEKKICVDGVEFLNVEKANNQQIYSTAEQIVGTWMGKPLYRKTLSDIAVNTEIQFTDSDVGIVMLKNGFLDLEYNSQNYTYPLPYCREGREIYIGTVDNKVTIYNTFADWNNCTATITLEYTKTTD